MPSHALGQAEYRALAEFRYHIRQFLRLRETAAHAAGIESQQYQFLLELKAIEGRLVPTVGLLAERLQLRHHSAVELIDRLVARALVRRRQPAHDRRRVLVELTARGRAVLEELASYSLSELKIEGPELARILSQLTHAHNGARPSRARRSRQRGGTKR